MKTYWAGTVGQLSAARAGTWPVWGGAEWSACLDALSGFDKNFGLVLGPQIASEQLHAALLGPETILLVRFSAAEKETSKEYDSLMRAMRCLTLGHGPSKGKRVLGMLALLGECKPHSYGQIPVVPAARLAELASSLPAPAEAFSAAEWIAEDARPCELVGGEKARAMLDQWLDALLDGFLSEAKVLSNKLQRAGYPLYFSDDFQALQQYLAGKEFLSCASSKARSLCAAAKEAGAADENGPDTAEYALVLWGEDMRWLGKWRVNGQLGDRREAYRALLKKGRSGFVIFLPSTADTLATQRALRDAGMLELQ
jgi:hypothetical protein